jgi:TolB protein
MSKPDKFFLRIVMLFAVTLFSSFLFAQKKTYKIVYNVLENREKDNYEIYSMNMDGSDKKNITNSQGVEWVYYASGNKVYYISDIDTCHRCYFLYEMDAEGNNKRKMTNLQLEDSWMSGREIVTGPQLIVLGRIGKAVRNQLFLVNIKDGSFEQITSDTTSTKRDPLFISSDRIIMPYRPDKALRKTVPDELWSFSYNVKEDGSDPLAYAANRKQLTFFPKTDTTTQWFEYHAGPPQWNSKYKFISYISRQKGQHQIYAITPNGKKQWQITSGEMGSGWHSWSSDGKWLAMDKSTPDEKSYDIYLMNYKTKKIIQLTSDAKYEQAPVIVETKKP